MGSLHQSSPSPGPRRWAVWVVILLLLAATSLWILNSENIIHGSWTSVLNPIFTCIGAILALLQWHVQITAEGSSETKLSQIDQYQPHMYLPQNITHKRKGAILVYTRPGWRGVTLHLLLGLQECDASLAAVTNVIAHQHIGRRLFLGYFPTVSPGHYTLIAPSKQRHVQVTVYAGYVSEIDWR